jgi:hypothetical protein
MDRAIVRRDFLNGCAVADARKRATDGGARKPAHDEVVRSHNSVLPERVDAISAFPNGFS